MRALHFVSQNQPLSQTELPAPSPADGQVTVILRAAAFNRRDYWIMKGMYPNVEYPVVPGGDGVGVLDGREVIIDAGIGWGNDERVQDKSFYLIGSPGQGSFAQQLCIPESNVYDKPEHLTFIQAAALPIAGVTAYRALFSRGKLETGEKVLVTGAGGGVALMAVQFALAAGAHVYVTSGSDEKIAAAMDLGARGGVNYRSNDWPAQLKALAGGFDMVIDSAGGDGFSNLLKICYPAARIVVYGGSHGYINKLSPQIMFWRQISILGTSMGSPKDFQDMLNFVTEHRIKPVIDSVYTFDNAQQAIDKLAKGAQFGKLVLKIPV